MSDSINDLIATVYYNGRRYFGPCGQVFEGDTKMFRMSPHCSFRDLKKIIYKKLRLERGEVLTRLIARCASGDPIKWIAVDIVDDEDVSLVIDAYRDYGNSTFIELYAEVERGGQTSNQAIDAQPSSVHSIDINREPPISDTDMGMSPPPPSAPEMPSEIIPDHDMYDPSWRTESSDEEEDDEEEDDEGLVPDNASSDTDVDGDFERCPSNAICQPIPSPGIIGTEDPPVPGPENVPFWSETTHFTNIDWSYQDEDLDGMHATQIRSWQMGQELYKD